MNNKVEIMVAESWGAYTGELISHDNVGIIINCESRFEVFPKQYHKRFFPWNNVIYVEYLKNDE